MRLFAAILLSLSLVSCSIIPVAKTPKQKVGLCFSTVSGLSRSAVDQIETNRLTDTQGDEVLHLLNNMNDVCTISKAAIGDGRETDAVTYLDAATMILDRVEEILNERR